MTEKEKTHITMLREQGYTYKQISDETGIGLSTVKMHFNRILARQRPARAETADDIPEVAPEVMLEASITDTPAKPAETAVETPVVPVETPTDTPVALTETAADTIAGYSLVCFQCGKPLAKDVTDRKRFCSDRCRFKWWKKHLVIQSDNAKYQRQCPVCGKIFFTYKSARYCSPNCYHRSRRKAG